MYKKKSLRTREKSNEGNQEVHYGRFFLWKLYKFNNNNNKHWLYNWNKQKSEADKQLIDEKCKQQPETKYIKDIYFFEVNTKYISSNVLKKSVISRVRSTSQIADIFITFDEIVLVFTEKK